jgi:hypothetical protein
MGSGVIYRGQYGRGVKLNTHVHPVWRLRMKVAIPPLPLYAFVTYRQL